MIAHPLCTCTRASLSELAEILARAEHRPRAYVVFVMPPHLPAGSDLSDLHNRAERIPGLTIVRDDDGLEAKVFGARTSGQVFLYGAAGQLLFSGGATGSRGHAGDNAGRAVILALLNDHESRRANTPVFGCSLLSAGDEDNSGQPAEHDHHHAS